MTFPRQMRSYSLLALVILLVLQALPFGSSAPVQANSVTTGSQSLNASAAPATFAAVAAPPAQRLDTDCASTSSGFGLSGNDRAELAQLQQAANNKAQIACHSRTGKLRFFGADTSAPVASGAALSVSSEQAARNFLGTYGSLFGLRDQANELTVMSNLPTNRGHSFIRFQQVYQGVPIIAGEVIVQVDQQNQILSVGGEILPDLQIKTSPNFAASSAQAKALSVVAREYNLPVANLATSVPQLSIYNAKILGGPSFLPTSTLVWRVDVTPQVGSSAASEPIQEIVLVDAQSGIVTLNFNQVAEAKNRSVCDRNNTVGAQADCTAPIRTEGSAAGAITDVNLAYDYAGATYDFYFNNFGRDSLDGLGLPLKSTTKLCPTASQCPYKNAFWTDSLKQMFYGDGFASADDVVAHELTHGFTSFTSHLFYYYQSGAINESLSDTFGEYVDLTDGLDGAAGNGANVRWKLGEDLPASIGIIRDMKNPPTYNDPDRTGSSLYVLDASLTDSGGVHTNSGVNNKAAYLIADGDTFNGQTITGLGIPKAAQIYYELETHLLTSGSDYQDMYNYLQQACTNLVGTHGITAADCQQVKKVVDATEMNLTPTQAPAPEAPICTVGQTPNNIFLDNLENTASGNWASSALNGTTNTWFYPANPNSVSFDARYATSGVNNFWGYDAPSVADYAIAQQNSVLLPANAYLHFRHSYHFDSSGSTKYDGGIIEYSTNGGATWSNAGSLITDNGYNSTLSNVYGNPLGGQQAFGGSSNGYYSSRLNLNSLANQSVRFRFRIGSDNGVDDYGWFIDDIRIYTCATGGGTATTTGLVSNPNPSTFGQSVIFTATVNPTAATGSVDFKEGTALLSTQPLVSGVATYTTAALSVGSHVISATYSGDANYAGSSTNLTQVVTPGGSCDPKVITLIVDNGLGNTCGTLSQALLQPVPGASAGITLTFALSSGNTITMTGALTPTVASGVTLYGGACSSGPAIVINGNGVNGDGLRLSGKNSLISIWVKGFAGRQIYVGPPNFTAALGTNVFSCVKASRF